MRSVHRLFWPLVILLVVGMVACATDTELNPQPLPPGQSGEGKRGDEENSPAPIGAGGSSGSSGTNAGADAGVAASSDGGDASDGGVD